MKIGFVFDDTLDSFDGVAQYVKTLGAWLSSQGHEVRYLVGETKMLDWSGGRVYSLSKNQKVSFNGNKLSMPLPTSSKKIREVLAKEKFDVLHIQVPYSPFMAQKVINNADSSTVIIGTFHVAPLGRLADWGSHGLRLLYGRSLRKFGQILSVSTAAQKYAKSAFHIRSNILPNVIEVNRFSEARTKKKTRDILFFGRLVKRKGAKELIEAFSILCEHNKKIRLTIAGSGPMRQELEGLAKRLGIDNRVEFLGFIEEADKPQLLASAEVVCFPSYGGESFGIVLLEAMAAGAGVVIGGDNPGYRSVIGAHSQLLFNPKHALSFAGRLSELLEDKKLRQDLHAWQQEEVKQYDVNIVGKKLQEIYEDSIAKQLNKVDN